MMMVIKRPRPTQSGRFCGARLFHGMPIREEAVFDGHTPSLTDLSEG